MMKTFKQRFSVWFNRNHRLYGTLWADRLKSVLVEGSGNPLQTMAAYTDLNPVHGFTGAWQREKAQKHPPKVNPMRGTDRGDLAVIQGLRRQVFG